MIGIYRLTSPSGRVNIGQSWDLERRKKDYKNGNHKHQPTVTESMKKYGWDAHQFDTLQELPEDTTQEVLDQLEIVFIEQYKECGFRMMNIKEGGSHGKVSEETKNKISKTLKGRVISKESIAKRVATCKNNWTEESSKRHSEIMKIAANKRVWTDEDREEKRLYLLGKKQSEELKRKKSLSMKEYYKSSNKVYKCAYCNCTCKSPGAISRWHNNNCKLKN